MLFAQGDCRLRNLHSTQCLCRISNCRLHTVSVVLGTFLCLKGFLVEIAWLRDFVSLAETGVFARAAEKRNVTQPAFTRRIKRLEYAVGINLVDRSVHPVVLTSAGQKLLSTARNMIYEWEKMRAEFADDSQKTAKIRIAVLQSLAVSYVPHLVKTLYPTGRAPRFQIIADNFAGCIEAVMSGDADAMICYSHKDIQTGDHVLDNVSLELATDRLIPVSCGQDGQPKFTLLDSEIPFLKYSSVSFLGRMTKSMLDKSREKLPLVPVYEDSIAAALKSAALEGLGVAWLPEALVRVEISAGTLINLAKEDPRYEAAIGVTIYRGPGQASHEIEQFWGRVNI